MSKMGAHVLKQQETTDADGAFEQSPAEQVLGEIELLPPDRPIAAYSPIKEAISKLSEQYGNVEFDVSTTAGMEAAKQARMAIRQPRYNIEHIRKALKAPALAYSKRIDEEAKDYTEQLLAIEIPIDEQIKAREQQVENARLEKERIAAEARRKVDQSIADVQFIIVHAAGKTSAQIGELITELEHLPIMEEEYGDRVPDAVLVKNSTLTRLRELQNLAAGQELEADRLRIEREDAERVRKEQEVEATRLAQLQQDLQRQQQTLTAAPVADTAPAPAPVSFEDVVNAVVPEPVKSALLSNAADLDDSDPFAKVVSLPPQAKQADIAAPTLGEMLAVLAEHYRVTPLQAEQWLRATLGQ